MQLTKKPDIPLLRFQSGYTHVAAGTVWLWARAEYFLSVDTLVIDEAGQMLIGGCPCRRAVCEESELG